MTALSPHIRVLSALADQFDVEAERAAAGSVARDVFRGMAIANREAAGRLDAEEKALSGPLDADSRVTFDKKGANP